MMLELNKMHYPVTALGPGRRVGLWTQGCGLACAGCISRDTWAPDPARAVDVGRLADWITSIPADEIDGVTISGGEPFDQPDALAALLLALRCASAARGHQLDLLCYSGYGLGRLRRLHGHVLELLDGVITGPFVAARPTRLVWRGSANQELVPLTDLGRERYGPYIDAAPERPPIQVAVDDSIWYVGVPRAGDIERLDAAVAAAGVRQVEASWRA
jgi:anaerobic ribonucleoside-triphosphate reductase activating protein